MIRYYLIRNELGLECTLGTLFTWGGITFATLEKPWRDNKNFISCVPKGVYRVVRHNTEDYPNTWRLLSVPNREGILIHIGNYSRETKGCILIGLQYNSKTSISKSTKALEALNKELENQREWEIEII